jgi:uncharacterized protein
LAVENEDEIAVQKLLEKGADISVLTSVPIHMDESGMLLQKAVRAGRLSMVKLLIHYGLDLDTKEHNECDGRTALHCAAAAGDVRMVDLLLGAGADINIRAYSDESGDTALGFAIDNDHDAIIQLLLENGADVDLGHSLASAICGTQKSTVHRLIEHEVDLEAPQGDFYTGGAAIHVAVNENCGEILELLLEHGANIEARDNCGYTALALAVVMRTTKIVQLLLQNGADTTSQSKEGETPLHLAAMGDYDGVVQLLLDFGADLSLKDRYGRTAAHLADLAGDDKTVQLLQVDATP